MNKKTLIALILLLISTNVCVSQNKGYNIIFAGEDSIMALVKPKYKWMGTDGHTAGNEMKLKYLKPKGFQQGGPSLNFDAYPRLSEALHCCGIGHVLRSHDGQFISSLIFFPIFTQEDQETLNRLFPQYASPLVDKQHRYQMRGILRKYYGEEICSSWTDSVTVFSTEVAHKKWNADSAFTFNLHLRPEDYYKKDFRHVKVLLIQRKGRGYAYIVSFYTDKAKENFNKYWRKIEKTLRYKD